MKVEGFIWFIHIIWMMRGIRIRRVIKITGIILIISFIRVAGLTGLICLSVPLLIKFNVDTYI